MFQLKDIQKFPIPRKRWLQETESASGDQTLN